jgi:DeoR/GlpR family transcriptional regulator of sugar metabolism
VLILERQRLILEHVRWKGLVSVRDVAKVLGTQERTVRRDLVALAGNGLVRRTRGGAVLPGAGCDITEVQLIRELGVEVRAATP